MRQLNIKVVPGKREAVFKLLEELKAKNVIEIANEEYVFIEFYLDNSKVQNFFSSDEAKEAEVMLNPHGVLPLQPPPGEAPEQVVDVSVRSPVEILLSGIQSVGSWGSLIGYSVASAVVAFIGLYTDVIYLLTASMLIAPFAGPVMNAALAGAAGEIKMLGNSLYRYVVAIGLSILVSLLLSLAVGVDVLPPLAQSISRLAHVNLILPFFAGFAGAVSIINSERNNLVSGAGVGILVAASLAPPSVILGMTIQSGDLEVLLINIYKLLLQVFGIQFSASLVFRYWGKIRPKGVRFHTGKNSVFVSSLVVALAGAVILGSLQFNDRPLFNRTTMVYEINKTSNSFFSNQNMQVLQFTAKITDEKSDERRIIYCEIILYDNELNRNKNNLELKKEYIAVMEKNFPELKFAASLMTFPDQ